MQSLVAMAFIGSFPYWYYDLRIGWLGLTYRDRVSMRWADFGATVVLAVCGCLLWKQARLRGNDIALRVFRLAALLLIVAGLFLFGIVVTSFAFVPYVPASFPPATPATWIAMTLKYAAPYTAAIAGFGFFATLIRIFSPETPGSRSVPRV